MDNAWFRKTDNGLCWKPVRWEGWAVTFLWIIGNLWYFKRIDALSSSTSDSLLNSAPFFIVSSIVFLIVVRRRSGRRWE